MLDKKIQDLLDRLENDQDKELVQNLFILAEKCKEHIERGYGSYEMMRQVIKTYDTELINLHFWTI